MSLPQYTVLAILFLTITLFLWGRWRHDMVAIASLLACVITGLVLPEHAFSGFSHPAVITVACILILSRALQNSGAIDALTRWILPSNAGPAMTLLCLTGLGALLSGFMNNVGALALLMPVAIQLSKRLEMAAGKLLMPLAFGTILGGMTTLIGTPPNLIVSGFRAEQGPSAFQMFDFAPIGFSIAAVGVIFISFIGYRLVPARRAQTEGFDTASYLTEARVPAKSKAVGMSLREVEAAMGSADAQVVGLIRNEVRLHAPGGGRLIKGNDILIFEADAEALPNALTELGLKLEEAGKSEDESEEKSDPETPREDSDDSSKSKHREWTLTELALLPGSPFVGRSARELSLRTRFGVNLLAVSRQGKRETQRLRTLTLRAGDLLLVQGAQESISELASTSGCAPLATRDLRIPDRKKALLATLILAAAILATAFSVLPAAIAFTAAVLLSMVFGTIQPRTAYDAIDWSVVILLAALIPVAGAMETTGTAEVLARGLLNGVAQGNAVIALSLILVVTMTLSDLMNNAATAAVMCPIALNLAAQLQVNPDSFLMAVAIGASCAFLTPIGHQNNTLILGPGGFSFKDYWRMGLPVELLVIALSLPLLLIVWPL